jgi:Icc-related predicted phosphoesterase
MPSNLVGPKGQLYADPKPTPDEVSFRVDNTSASYYKSVYYLNHKNQVQRIPQARNTNPLDLATFVSADILSAIDKNGMTVFHAVGDTGAAKVSRSQTAATAIEQEARVADAMVAEVNSGGVNGPAFFFHLGDVIYNFGEAQYYYDQFYEPFREYDRPIFAIPGNHDGMVFGAGSSAPQVPTLDAFLTNFCAVTPGPSPDAGTLVRSVMTQPGVYFVLDAPFVSIIGLYTNVLDSGPGIISSQGSHYPIIDDQLDFLEQQLTRLKADHDKQKRAVILATHHPPLSADARHGGSSGIIKDIDSCCKKANLWPDMVLSGHAHLYQRFTRVVNNGQETPYIVSGSGGFAATAPKSMPTSAPVTVGDHTLEIVPIIDFGYLTLETDGGTLTATFKTSDAAGVRQRDSVTVDIKSGKIVRPGAPGKNAGGAKRKKKSPPAKK